MPVVPFIPAVLGAGASLYTAKRARESSERAVDQSVAGQEQSLQYQQEVEALPLAFRDAGMNSLGGEYGLTMDNNGNVISDGSTIQDRAMNSPFYTGALEAGEDAIGRYASANGRLRGGATPARLGRNAQNAFMQSYNNQLQGLSSFARSPLNTAGIANTMSGIGNTYAQGSIAQGQINQGMYGDLANAAGSGLRAFLSRTPTHTSPANQLTDAQIAGRIQL